MKTTVGTRFTFINMIISIIYHNPHIGVQKVSTPIELRELHYIDRLLATSTSHLRYCWISFIARFHFIVQFFHHFIFMICIYVMRGPIVILYLWILLIVIISIVMMVVRIAIVMVMVVCIAI